MGEVRSWSPHVRWSNQEIKVLREFFESPASCSELRAMLPGRGIKSIQAKAASIGLKRLPKKTRPADEVRQAKAAHMARKRAENPEIFRQRKKEFWAKNRDRLNLKTRTETARRIFWARSLRLRNGISARDLASLWKRQRGRCALSGEQLGRDAEIDHKIPRAQGGTDALINLQWVTARANRAKRDLTDQEFLALCQACASWIPKRIQCEVDRLDAQRAAA